MNWLDIWLDSDSLKVTVCVALSFCCIWSTWVTRSRLVAIKASLFFPTQIFHCSLIHHCMRFSYHTYEKCSMNNVHDLITTHSNVQTSKVAKIINHKDYNGKTKQHDIALMKLQTPLVFNKYVRPIPVWSGELPSLKRCTVTGWGSTTEGRYLCSDLHQDWRTCSDGLFETFKCGQKESEPLLHG